MVVRWPVAAVRRRSGQNRRWSGDVRRWSGDVRRWSGDFPVELVTVMHLYLHYFILNLDLELRLLAVAISMDPNSNRFSDFISGFKVDDETVVPNANQYSNTENGFKFTIPSPDLNFLDIPFNPLNPDPGIITPSSTASLDLESLGASTSLSPDGSSFARSSGWSPEGEASSPSDDSDSSNPVLKYISQMLMEEKMEEKPCMFYDPLALQATERSLYEVLGERQPYYPPSLNQPQPYVYLNSGSGEKSNIFSNNSSDFNSDSGAVSSTSSGGSDFVESLLVGDTAEFNGSFLRNPLPEDYHSKSNSQQHSSQFSVNPPDSMTTIGSGLMSSVNEFLAQNMLSDRESILQFKKGMEEASKFLPTGNQLIIDLESYGFSTEQKEDTSRVVVKVEKEERENSPEGSRGACRTNTSRQRAPTDALPAAHVGKSETERASLILKITRSVKPSPKSLTTPFPKRLSHQHFQAMGSNRCSSGSPRREVRDRASFSDLEDYEVSETESKISDDAISEMERVSTAAMADLKA
ncbi:hypothetical protein WN944_019809 [Citrus x changshan-huyou]|uniref:Uncharacterized protein n=1 Tax=Citrus x changshan-huyou TaxID=2935761 RepID=A0AAP0QJU3_9ROSI